MKRLVCLVILIAIGISGCAHGKGDMSLDAQFEAFMNNEVPAYRSDGSELWKADLTFDDNDWNCYRVGECVDVDNDGEDEQFIDGPGGGIFLDYRGGEIYVWPVVSNPVGVLTYRIVDDNYWVIYMDTLSSNREYYRMLLYNGIELLEDYEVKKLETDEGHFDYYINDMTVTEQDYIDFRDRFINE